VARLSGLSRSTVSTVLDGLNRRGYLKDVGKGAAYHWRTTGKTPEGEMAEMMDKAEKIELAYQHGHQAAQADAQACKSGQHGGLWRSREHAVPEDADARAAWMRGYGKQFAYWGGEQF
jgi:hypothetical protein